MSDTTIFKGKSDKSEAKSQNEKTKTQKGSTLASAGAGVVAGAAAGLGATYATTARAAEPVEVEDIAAEQAQEPKVEAAAAAHHQSAAAPKPQEPESALAAEESQQADATPQAQEPESTPAAEEPRQADATPQAQEVHVHNHIHVHTHGVEERQEPTPEPNPNPDEVPEEVLENFEIEGVRIVGAGMVDGHVAVAYDVNGDNNTDVAIVDVDDNLTISDADVVIGSNGQTTTVGQLSEAAMQGEEQNHAVNTSCDDPHFAQNPDVAPDMPDYMNDGIVEA